MSDRGPYQKHEAAHPGHYIREWRKLRKLSQEKIAAKVGMSVPQVSKIESGLSGYRQETLQSFAAALNCRPADLLTPPPTDGEGNELESYVRDLDDEKRKRALDLLRIALGDSKTGK